MISFLAPAFFQVALAVAAGAVALHFLVRRQPRSHALPTARFVPAGAVETVTTSRRPHDLLTLLLRVLTVLLVGAAFARPVLLPSPVPVLRIVLADISRGVASADEVRDSVRALLGESDVLIVFDSAARRVDAGTADAIAGLGLSEAPARLSPALVAAMRVASEVRGMADSIELAIVSPLGVGVTDAATGPLRALWPGRIRMVPVSAAAREVEPRGGVAVHGDADDPVGIAAIAAGLVAADGGVHVVRDLAGTAGRAPGPGDARVRWPVSGAPAGWLARPSPDSVGAVVATVGGAEAPLVAPFVRRWRLADDAPPARVIARWVDGEPAAIERIVGGACVREVMVDVPRRGDLVLRPQFARFLAAMTSPCHARDVGAPLSSAEQRALAGDGPLAATALVPRQDEIATPLVAWLLAAALLFALLEILVRRSVPQARTPAADGASVEERADPPRHGAVLDPERAA